MSYSTLNPSLVPIHDAGLRLELRLHHASAIRASPSLAETIRAFVNEGYRYMSPQSKLRWDYIHGERLPTAESIFDIVGEDGMFAVLYCQGSDDGGGDRNGNGNTRENGEGGWNGTPIACAATKRWRRDLEGYKGPAHAQEEGWEILTVTTLPEFMKRGYAGRCIDALVEELQSQASHGGSGKLRIWTQAVEELNGVFWRNRGWTEVRSYEKPVGHWESRCGYKLLVLVRDFEFSGDEGWKEKVESGKARK